MKFVVSPGMTLTLDFSTTFVVQHGDDKEALRREMMERVGRRFDQFLDAIEYSGDCDG